MLRIREKNRDVQIEYTPSRNRALMNDSNVVGFEKTAEDYLENY